MTDDPRSIARRARRLGYSSVVLGNATERHWQALRVVLGAEDVSDRTLADVVDEVARFEQDTNQVGV